MKTILYTLNNLAEIFGLEGGVHSNQQVKIAKKGPDTGLQIQSHVTGTGTLPPRFTILVEKG